MGTLKLAAAATTVATTPAIAAKQASDSPVASSICPRLAASQGMHNAKKIPQQQANGRAQ
eukprot:scaffold11876_cov31-Cyclotella_meneghiniana.AAC.2